MKEVKIYTDGACIGNPGPGGYGVVLIYGNHRKEFSGGFRKTTNNRMELFAAIAGLKKLKERCKVELFSDSKYLVDAINKGWVDRWRANGWHRKGSQMASNIDLWIALSELYEFHEVEFIWVKGHADNIENNRCDELANSAADKPALPIDSGYQTDFHFFR